jgi:hypothetical protein
VQSRGKSKTIPTTPGNRKLRRTAWWSWQDSNLQTIGGTGGFQKTETALSRVSGGKAAEGQRLFRRRQETGIAQDCVVELAVLK